MTRNPPRAYDMEHLGDWIRALLEPEGRGGGPAGHGPGLDSCFIKKHTFTVR